MPISSDDVLVRRAMRRLGGSLCGRYSLSRLIGIGGMAAVYAGVHRNGHAVAVKILHERLAADPEIERLFRREAHLANAIGHPGVVPVIDDDVTEDGCVFLVMPLLLGETLRARAARLGKTLPIQEVVVVAHAVLEALTAAHAKKVVHRDIKPENIFVTVSGEVKVLDFGIGRFFQTNEAASVTRSGRALGTPAFMAPEQALGRQREIDGRADLWALGATMFTLVTGRIVHQAETPTEVAVLAATRPAPLLEEVAPNLPEAFRQLIDRALAFRKEDRWSHAEAMDQALLRACQTALGEPLDGLASVRAPDQTPSEEFDGLPTATPEMDCGAAIEPAGAPPDTATRNEWVAGSPDVRGAQVAPAAPPAGAAQRALPRWRTTRIISGVLALAALIGGTAGSARMKSINRAVPSVAAGGVSPGVSPARGDRAPAATELYGAGMQLWRDASIGEAVDSLSRATELDPSFAAAHLRIVLLSSFMRTASRVHFQQADRYRASLGDEDRELLSALAPAISDPPDWNSALARLELTAAKFPADQDLPLMIARRLVFANQAERALSAADRALSRQESAVGWSVRANAYVQLDQLEDARKAFRRCLEISSSSTTCAQMLLQLEANEGRCDEVERLAHQLTAMATDNPDGYELLAGALFARTGSVAVARAAAEQGWSRIPEPDRPLARWRDEFALDVFAGEFDKAKTVLDSWETHIATEPGAAEHGNVAYRRMRLELQRGHNDRTIELAHEYQLLSQAWSPDDLYDFHMATLRLLYLAGGIETNRFRSERDAWLRDPREAFAFVSNPAFLWIEGYAGAVRNREDAMDALAHLPKERPYFSATIRDAEMDEMTGLTYLAAGDLLEARTHLSRAAHSCMLSEPLSQTRASLELGQVFEQLQDTQRACEAYRVVVQRWGHEPSSVDAHAALSRSSALHCSIP